MNMCPFKRRALIRGALFISAAVLQAFVEGLVQDPSAKTGVQWVIFFAGLFLTGITAMATFMDRSLAQADAKAGLAITGVTGKENSDAGAA